jgi:hypothetical protein
MSIKHVFTIVLALAITMLLVGCGEVPQAEIDEAKAALDAAKNAEADKYVPDLYNAAKRTLDNAMAMIEEEKSAMFSNYDDAAAELQKAKDAAGQAAEAVPAKKEEVKAEVENLLAQIPEVVAETKMKWKKAPRGKGTHEPLQLIKKDIEATEAMVGDVNTTLEQGDLLLARQKAQDIINKLRSIQAELE